ncbi:MAG: PfkB family carbohydrate kinase [Methylotenera sp.]
MTLEIDLACRFIFSAFIPLLILNDGEARQFSGKASLIQAGRLIQSWGPKFVVVKKGEHGVLLFSKKNVFSAPAYPLEEVFDPTGAGDTFAGGFVGYLNKQGNRLDEANSPSRRSFTEPSWPVLPSSVFRSNACLTVRPPDITRRLTLLHRMSRPSQYLETE